MDMTPDRLTLANRERRERDMSYAYADGYGVWHAVIPPHVKDPERAARRLITAELDMRGELTKGYRVRVKREQGRVYTTDAHRFVEA